MRLAKHLLILLVCSLIISCSLVKTSYNNAPALVVWWLDNYFNFTPAQNLVLKPALERLHHWHRQHQLPHYVTLLQVAQTSLASEGLTANDACKQLNAIKLSMHALQTESIPIIVEMAPLLSDAQMARFQKKLDERSEEWKSDWWQETREEQLAVRLEKTEDFAKKVYGDLDEAQLNLLKQRVAQANINPEIRYKEILRRNQDAYQIVSELKNQSLSRDEKSQLVKAGFDRIHNSPNQAYQAHADAQAQHTCQTIADLHARTSAQQKLHAKNWINDYLVQLAALLVKINN
jgi:hypothetical protein